MRTTAAELAHREIAGMFADAIAGGVLVALLSHFLDVVVTVLHVFFGIRFGAEIGVRGLATTMGV